MKGLESDETDLDWLCSTGLIGLHWNRLVRTQSLEHPSLLLTGAHLSETVGGWPLHWKESKRRRAVLASCCGRNVRDEGLCWQVVVGAMCLRRTARVVVLT